MKKTIITFILFAVCISVNAQNWWNSKTIKGNGNVITKTRTIDEFDSVALVGSFDLNLVDGDEGKITINAEENLIPYIITEVEGGELKVKFKKNINVRTYKKIVITIPFEEIDGVVLSGSGDIVSEKTIEANTFEVSLSGSGDITLDVEANNIETNISGSGDVKLSGKTKNFDCAISGSGDIHGYELEVTNLKAAIAGSGNIKATVLNKIEAGIAGSGDIYYKGKPKYIDVGSVGSGDAIDKN